MKTSFKIQKFKQHKIHFRAIKKSSARGKHRELFFFKSDVQVPERGENASQPHI